MPPISPNEIAEYGKSRGLSDNHVKGLIANIQAESRFQPDIEVNDKGKPAGGLFQHRAERLQGLQAAVPDWRTNWKGQIDYALSEPEGQQYRGQAFASPAQAAQWFTKNFERPENADTKAQERGMIADGGVPSGNLGTDYMQQRRAMTPERQAGDELLSRFGLDQGGEVAMTKTATTGTDQGAQPSGGLSTQQHAAGAADRIKKIRADQAKEPQPSFMKDVIGGTVAEIPRALIGGARDAAKELLQSADSLAGYFERVTGMKKGGGFGVVADALPDLVAKENNTPGGKLLRGIAQFVTGYVTGGKALGVTGKITKPLIAGAFSDAAAFDPNDPTLSNLINETFPKLKNPLTEFLATDPKDNEAFNRFKRAAEGMGLGVAMEVVMALARWARAGSAVKRVEKAFEQAKTTAPGTSAAQPSAASQVDVVKPPTGDIPLGTTGREGVMVSERLMLPAPGQATKTADEIADNAAREIRAQRTLEGNPTLNAAREATTIKNEVVGNPTLRAAYETTLRGESEEAIIEGLVKRAKPELEAVAKEVFTSAKESEAVSKATVGELERGLLEEAPVGIPKGEARPLAERAGEPLAGQTATVLPPVEKGFVRLYRGQTGEFKAVAENPKLTELERGRWFSSDKEAAGFHGKDGVYVDVPQAIADAAVVEDSLFNKTGRLLPFDWANKAKPLQPATQNPNVFNQKGEIKPEVLHALARAAVGGAIGLTQGDTLEERITNGLAAAGIAVALKPSLLKKLVGAMDKVAPEQMRVIKSFDPPVLNPTARGTTARPPKAIGPVQVASEAQAKEFLAADPDAIKVGNKAIKINWSEVNDIKAQDDIIKTVTKLNEESIDVARRGVQSDEKRGQLANMLGVTEEDMMRRRRGQALNAEQTQAFIDVYGSAVKELDNLATALKNGEQVENQFRLHLGRTTALTEQIFGARAESGRALRVWGQAAQELKGPTQLAQQLDMLTVGGRNIQDIPAERLADMILALNSPAQKATFLTQAFRGGKSMLLEAWMNGLLSNPVTHAGNIMSNAVTTFTGIAERSIAGAMGSEVARGEATAMISGVLGGWRDALDLAGRSFKAGESQLGFSKMENVGRAITAENIGVGGQFGRAVDMIGAVVSTPGRALMAADDFFKGINYRAELEAQAWRQASKEGLKGGALKTRAGQLARDTDFTSLVKDQAENFAFYQTFNQELGALGEGYIRFLGDHPWMRVITPFVRTPVNIAKYTLERTPILNLAMNQVRADLLAGGAKRDLTLAKMAVGGMVFSTATALAMSDTITGGGPKNPELLAIKRATGWQPYSVHVGDQYISFNRFDWLGFPLGLAADFVEKAGEMKDGDLGSLAVAGVVAMNDVMVNKTYLSGLNNFMEAIQAPERKGEKFLEKLAGSLVPAGVAQIARQFDPALREANGAADAIFARLPGFSGDLPPRRNIWGEAIQLEGAIGPDLISPFYTSSKIEDPVSDEILRLKIPIPMWRNYIYGMQPSDSAFARENPNAGVRLLPEEYDRMVQLAGKELKLDGKTLHERLENMINSPSYIKQGVLGKEAFIRQTFTAYGAAAVEQIVKEFPDLKTEIQNKMGIKREAYMPEAAQ